MGSIAPKDESQPTHTSESSSEAGSPYVIKEEPIGTLRHVRIVTIGAGVSGINMIRTLRLHTTSFEHVVYEKNPDIGGTWYENRYPGCRCDIPSHNYQFSHTPNPGWSAMFSDAREIEGYLHHVCDVHDLRRDIKCSHSVVFAKWDNEKGEWCLKVRNEVTGEVFDDRCHFLLDASGILNAWKWPEINGLHSFKGDLVHSANWPKNFDYKKKRVAVIGNGSSGVQILPALQPDVEKLVHFVRSPTWIVPPQSQRMAQSPDAAFMGSIKMKAPDEDFTEEQIEEFRKDPEFYMKFVKVVEKQVNSKFKMLVDGSPESQMARKILTMYMSAMLKNDEKLKKALIPDFPVGCRRMTPGVSYLTALTQDNVQVVTDDIQEVCPEGIRLKSGELIEIDAIVCATGFDLSFVPRFPIIGESENLQDRWRGKTPEAYMSCMVAGMPNYFTFLGPNAPIGHGSVLTITEHLAKYITKIIKKCQLEHYTCVSPTQSAVSDFSEHIRTFMPRTAWSGSCISWFKGGEKDGPVTALHPGSRIHWFHMLESPRWEDFEWKAEGRNRFGYLGNGLSTREEEDGDQTWYLDCPDAL